MKPIIFLRLLLAATLLFSLQSCHDCEDINITINGNLCIDKLSRMGRANTSQYREFLETIRGGGEFEITVGDSSNVGLANTSFTMPSDSNRIDFVVTGYPDTISIVYDGSRWVYTQIDTVIFNLTTNNQVDEHFSQIPDNQGLEERCGVIGVFHLRSGK